MTLAATSRSAGGQNASLVAKMANAAEIVDLLPAPSELPQRAIASVLVSPGEKMRATNSDFGALGL
jgi:hypothetical protein